MTQINSVGANPIVVANGGTGLATLTAHAVYVGAGTSAPTALAVGTTGQVLTANSSADPSWVNLPAFNVVDSTGTTQAMAVNTKYVSDHASALVIFTLPATATLGQTMSVIGNGPGGWQINQNASQAIKLNGQTTTTGTGGSLSSTNRYNAVTLQCVVAGASTIWNAAEVSGALTVV